MSKEDNIKQLAEDALAVQKAFTEYENELMQDERFKTFLIKQKEVQKEISDTWKQIETAMIENDVKSVKGDWGSITIAERLNWKTDETLPAKFYKKTVDTKRISDTYRLEGKAPKGATPSTTKYLTKRIKD